ncbi:hypothetical protein J5X07_08035 [Actinomyces bowdenii]|uniref:Uncharacterized protein n=1 Tax=Actinomyces bowdenii TaxID=131109 RepID=A0A3P1V8N3_9ACTO|nr:hypothetical protein [Actinomyces bowdenii]MBO3724974.1 hypothetical protein [Actinomyces bowdenii]RRD28953.1 hypothetical protein EII10_08330 [Actinomyces bowdenii]
MTDSRLFVVSDQSPFADALLARIARRSGLPVKSDREDVSGVDAIVLAGTGVDLGRWREWEDVSLAHGKPLLAVHLGRDGILCGPTVGAGSRVCVECTVRRERQHSLDPSFAAPVGVGSSAGFTVADLAVASALLLRTLAGLAGDGPDAMVLRKRRDEVTPCAVQVVPVDGCERCETTHRDAREGALEDLRDLCGSR